MSAAGAFVLAVTGGEEHLRRGERLAGALAARSRRRVAIATDPAWNPRPLAHGDVVAIATGAASPAAAAIELKLRLAELLPEDAVHAYLDSDVVPIADDLEPLFAAFDPPVTFAPDLPAPGATLRRFSSHALACPCRVEADRLERFFARLEKLTALHRAHGEFRVLEREEAYRAARFAGERRGGKWWTGEAAGEIEGGIRFNQSWRDGRPRGIVYTLAGSSWRLEIPAGSERGVWRDGDWSFAWRPDPSLESGGYWESGDGDSFRREALGDWWHRAGERRRRWRADPAHDLGGRWLDAAGEDLGECDHLAEALERVFGVAIRDRRFVPWNGGVFLFGPGCRGFFADWRERWRVLRARPEFTLRDQGALVASVWALGLEDHPRLPAIFNRIADRRAPGALQLSLASLLGEGVRLVHLIGGGIDDPDWRLARELGGLTASRSAVEAPGGSTERPGT
ncbi:MAG: hypothetical protein U0X73_06930 [Thermoanaerobaculia bacterium]